METVVIAFEELAHYAESTARTMPVTGVVPRAVAEDQIRHALRALREKRRRLDASAPDGGARWLLDNLWLCEREGASALAAFHAAGRLRTRLRRLPAAARQKREEKNCAEEAQPQHPATTRFQARAHPRAHYSHIGSV